MKRYAITITRAVAAMLRCTQYQTDTTAEVDEMIAALVAEIEPSEGK